MPSLRRSLTVYLLLLFAAALTAVGVVADRFTVDALNTQQRKVEKALHAEFDERKEKHREGIETQLLAQAQMFGRDIQVLYYKQSQEAFAEYVLSMNLIAGGYPQKFQGGLWSSLLWDPRWGGWHVGAQISRTHYTNLRLPADFVDQLEREARDDAHPNRGHLYQINSPVFVGPSLSASGFVWRSPGVGDLPLPFALSAYDTAKMPMWDHRFEDLTLADGRAVRRVVLKTPLPAPFGNSGPFPPRRGNGPGPGPGRGRPDARPPAPPPPTAEQVIESAPRVYVQVARQVMPDDDEYADEIAWRDEELRVTAERTAGRIAGVRLALVVAGLVGFVGVGVGVPILVRRGLRPVATLSDAVSRVSERDFRLPVEKGLLTEELVPIHDRLTHSLDALKRAFEREKEAVADISHELRTPVAGLLATIDVALRKPRTADQYKQTLEDCRGITKQLGGLVERVMTLAYLDSGQTTRNDTPTDAAELAADCAAVIRPLAESHGLHFRVDATQPAELTTDPEKLREVMINLLHNAVEYNKPGGDITLRVHPNAAGQVVVEVADTGIGMTPDVRGKIFDRFYRADPSRTATGVHAGLGLAIVKEYVDRLGGTISVETEPDRGSTFRVHLPA